MDSHDPVAHAETVIQKADALDQRIDDKTVRLIGELVTYRDRSRTRDRIMAVVVSVLVAIVGVLAFTIIKINDNAATIKAACESLNRANQKQIDLWQFLIDRSTPAEDEAAEQFRLAFEAKLHDTFRLFDCTAPEVIP